MKKCWACKKTIPPDDLYTLEHDYAYHKECFLAIQLGVEMRAEGFRLPMLRKLLRIRWKKDE